LGNATAGHIIDPENGKPLETKYALSVVVKTGTASDALSTTLLLVGPEKGKTIVKALPNAAAIWVSAAGETETVSTGPEIRVRNAERREPAAKGLAGTVVFSGPSERGEEALFVAPKKRDSSLRGLRSE